MRSARAMPGPFIPGSQGGDGGHDGRFPSAAAPPAALPTAVGDAASSVSLHGAQTSVHPLLVSSSPWCLGHVDATMRDVDVERDVEQSRFYVWISGDLRQPWYLDEVMSRPKMDPFYCSFEQISFSCTIFCIER